MWDLPKSGIRSVSPALAGGFFTTEPAAKPGASILARTVLAAFFFFLAPFLKADHFPISSPLLNYTLLEGRGCLIHLSVSQRSRLGPGTTS